MMILILQMRNVRHIELNNLFKVKQLSSSRTRTLTQIPDTFKIGILFKIFPQKRVCIGLEAQNLSPKPKISSTSQQYLPYHRRLYKNFTHLTADSLAVKRGDRQILNS